MPLDLPAPSFLIAAVRRAHVESERGARFVDFLDRLAAREAARDPETGLTAAEAERERAYRVRARRAEHRRVGGDEAFPRPALAGGRQAA